MAADDHYKFLYNYICQLFSMRMPTRCLCGLKWTVMEHIERKQLEIKPYMPVYFKIMSEDIFSLEFNFFN